MARTGVKSSQITDESIERQDLCSTIEGKSVIKKIIPGAGISIASTGADQGTGDVTISVDSNSIYNQQIFTQPVESTNWTIVHELNSYPEVVIIDADGNRVYCDLIYHNNSTVEAIFKEDISGIAALTSTKLPQVEFIQFEANSIWSIQHNLNRYPDVIILDSSMDNTRIYGDIKYIDNNSLVVLFNSALTGRLYLI